MDRGAWWAPVHGVARSQTRLSDFTFTFHFHALEKEMATRSSVLAWRIPGKGEPGGLLSMGSHSVGHDWSNLAAGAGASQVVLVVKKSPANAGDTRDRSLIPGLERYPGGGNGNLLQYSCLKNPTDRGAWQATIHGVTKSLIRLKQLSRHTCKIQKLANKTMFYFSSVQFSHSVMSDSLWLHELQRARPPCPSPTPGVHSNSRPSSRWCHPAISSLVIPFSSCPQSLPASESFPMSQLFTWCGQNTGVSALACST